MKLAPLDSPELIRLAAGWLSEPRNAQWLDFGDGRQAVSPEWLKIAIQRGAQVVRTFTADEDDRPIGVVGLSNISPRFKTATIWVVLGDRSCARRGYASRAMSAMLTLGFTEMGLQAINTFVAEGNPSVGVALRVGFRPVGRQRQCHTIDGQSHDRLLFDLLATEHEELRDAGLQHTA